MSIFNEEQIKAMFSREYICHECGHLMEFEDEWEDTTPLFFYFAKFTRHIMRDSSSVGRARDD